MKKIVIFPFHANYFSSKQGYTTNPRAVKRYLARIKSFPISLLNLHHQLNSSCATHLWKEKKGEKEKKEEKEKGNIKSVRSNETFTDTSVGRRSGILSHRQISAADAQSSDLIREKSRTNGIRVNRTESSRSSFRGKLTRKPE